jgi:hypothetical protein
MPAPMPLEPPVTRATLPLNDFACICHQNPPSHLLCPFWIILSRMTVQRGGVPGCPTRSFFLSFCFSQRGQRQRKHLTSRHPDGRQTGSNQRQIAKCLRRHSHQYLIKSRASLSMFSFRLCDVSAVDGEAGSGNEARFFRRQVRDKAGDLRNVTHPFQRNERLNPLCVR